MAGWRVSIGGVKEVLGGVELVFRGRRWFCILLKVLSFCYSRSVEFVLSLRCSVCFPRCNLSGNSPIHIEFHKPHMTDAIAKHLMASEASTNLDSYEAV